MCCNQVEDIIDTGLTIVKIRTHLLEQCGAASVKVASLLDKRERRKVVYDADYVGFTVSTAPT